MSLVLKVLQTVETWVQTLQRKEVELAEPSLEIARQVDEKGKVSLIKGVARDRRISVEDAEMRHGRKSRSVRVDGYKRQVLHDLDTGLIRAVGITPANVPEESRDQRNQRRPGATSSLFKRTPYRPGLFE